MKITKPIVFLVALLATGPLLHAQVKTPDSLVHRIFATLKAKDEKAFVSLYPNGQQFGRFMRTIMEGAMKSEQMQEVMGMDEKTKNLNIDSLIDTQVAMFMQPEMVNKMQEDFSKTFHRIIEKGEQKGVNWSQAQLTSFSLDTSAVKGDENMPFELSGLKEAKGVIDFTVGDSAYQLVFGKMMYIQSEGGWFGAEFPQLARKGESLTPDATAKEEGDEDEATVTKEAPAKKPVAASKAKAAAKKPVAKPKAAPAKKKPTA